MGRDKERFQDDREEPTEDDYERQERSQSPQRPQRRQHSPQQPLRQSQRPREEYETEGPVRRPQSRLRRSERLPEEYYETDYPSRRVRPREDEDYYEAPVRRPRPRRYSEEIETDPVRVRRSRPVARPRRVRETRPLPPAKSRSVWPWLLLGCAGGILLVALAAAIVIATTFHIIPGGNIGGILSQQNTYTKSSSQPLTSITHLSQMQVHNQVGNVSILLDPNASGATLTTVKKVKATSQSDANKEFDRIAVQVQPKDTSLTVGVTLPDQSGGVLVNANDSVDVTITLPFSSVSSPNTSGTPSSAASTTFDIATSVGNVTVNGLSGVLSVKVDTGNITAQHVALANGSHLQTGTGNVTFDGSVDTSTSTSASPANFKLQSEIGKLDVTLPADTNVTLDANTNVGKINTDFNINPQTNNGAVGYYGPLNPSAATPPTAVLTLDVSTGDINLHKAATG